MAEELQHLQLPGEQPQQGLADDRTDVSNKEPLHKCSGEDNDATKGTATEATAAEIVEENTKAGPPDQTKVPQPINYAPMEGGRGPNLASTKLRCRKLNGCLKHEDLLS